LLNEWKRAQLVPEGRGVRITDDQAAEAIAESHNEISIQGHVLSFGGQGGNAMGAAGGGGAAIGGGAIGGGGGPRPVGLRLMGFAAASTARVVVAVV
jgi:hypothetical protein